MRKLLFILLLIPFFGVAQSDTTKYNKSPNYGEIFRRVKPYNLLLPTDTTNFKYGFAQKGTTTYIGNGTFWTATSGGGGSVDSLTYARWLRLYKVNDSMKVVYSNLYSLPSQTGNNGKYLKTDGTNASWGKPNFSDSVDFTGSGVGMYLRINPGGSGANKYDFASVGGISTITGFSPIVVTGTGSFRDIALDTSYASGVKTNLRATNDSAVLAAAINAKPNFGDIRDEIADSLGNLKRLRAGTSAGVKFQNNSGATVAEYGLGGGTNFDFHGFAGYNANRSSSYTSRSFVTKNDLDSTGLLKVNKTGDVISGRLTTQSLVLNKDSVPITTTNVWNLTIDTATNRVQRIFRFVPFADTTVTASYTLTARDLGRKVYVNSASAVTISMPTTSTITTYGTGYDITVYQIGAGIITFAANGNTLNSFNTWLRSGGQHVTCGITPFSSNTYVLFGNIMP